MSASRGTSGALERIEVMVLLFGGFGFLVLGLGVAFGHIGLAMVLYGVALFAEGLYIGTRPPEHWAR